MKFFLAISLISLICISCKEQVDFPSEFHVESATGWIPNSTVSKMNRGKLTYRGGRIQISHDGKGYLVGVEAGIKNDAELSRIWALVMAFIEDCANE